MTTDAALVAGGRSRRFGSDKAFADWQGEPLWSFQLRKLLQIPDFSKVWLSANSDQPFPDHIEGVTRIDDVVDDIGPLGAFKSIFEASSADQILVLAVDMPLISEFRECGQVPKIEGRWEPLAAVYPREPMSTIFNEAIVSGDFSLQKCLDLAESNNLISAYDVPEVEKKRFTNLNTLEEFETVKTEESDEHAVLKRYRKDHGFSTPQPDLLALEEPLEIRVNGKSVSVMMRTPGHDDELAAGFLYTEGIIKTGDEILRIEHCPDVDPSATGNTLNIELKNKANLDQLTRHVFTSSSCGVCGKATIDSVFQDFPPIENSVSDIDPEIILSLPGKLRAEQETFDKTGGLHASAIFDLQGNLKLIREDVGRHNALDKVIGRSVLDKTDLSKSILLVSGRISFELMQKALSAKIPVVAGISAPSSLAVKLANESGITLIGFLRERVFNLYRV